MAKAPKVLTPVEKKSHIAGYKLVLKDNREQAKEIAATLKAALGVLAAATKAAVVETKDAQKLATVAVAIRDAAIKGISRRLLDAEKNFGKAKAMFDKLNTAAEVGKTKLEAQIAELSVPTAALPPTVAAKPLVHTPAKKPKAKAKAAVGKVVEPELEAA